MSLTAPLLPDLESSGVFRGLSDLQAFCYQSADIKGFHDRDRELKNQIALAQGDAALLKVLQAAYTDLVANRLALIIGEAIEAHEEIRHGHSPSHAYYKGLETGNTYDTQSPLALEKPEGVPSEIADVVIRCLDFAGTYGFDLGQVIHEKLAFNQSREHLHGGKKF